MAKVVHRVEELEENGTPKVMVVMKDGSEYERVEENGTVSFVQKKYSVPELQQEFDQVMGISQDSK
jgi:CheY-like chemotaxis protein